MANDMKEEQSVSNLLCITDVLQKEINDGLYAEGDKLPSESALCQRFQTNRYTVRHALDRLVQVGLIRSKQGLGYFVNEKPLDIQYSITPFIRFSDMISQSGLTPSANLLSCEKVEAPRDIRNKLYLKERDLVYKLKIVRFADQIPVTCNETWLPETLFPELELHYRKFQSLYQLFEENYQVYPKRTKSTFQASYPTAMESENLKVSPNTPLLIISSIVCDSNKNCIEYTVAKYRGDLCAVSIDFS